MYLINMCGNKMKKQSENNILKMQYIIDSGSLNLE